MNTLPVKDAASLGTTLTSLLPAAEGILPSCLVGHNFIDAADVNLIRHAPLVYSERTYRFPAVDFVQLPQGTILHPGRNFIVSTSEGLIAEQVPVDYAIPDSAELDRPETDAEGLINVDRPSVMVSRFGIQTWGHWLGEIFPKVLLVEAAFPGVYTYIVPQDILNGLAPRNEWNSIWECFKTLNIGRDRVYRAYYDRAYKFSELHIVTPVFRKNVFHPDLLAHYRSFYLSRDLNGNARGSRRIAILRTESPARNITNVAEVADVLRDFDFEFVEIGRLPFLEQVHIFSQAKVIAGVLASGLSGLFFSPSHVKLLSFAPVGYVNEFFVPILQQLQGSMYDVRGPITRLDSRSFVFSDFNIDKDAVTAGITALGIT